ncbi:hypothetical protein ACIBL3_28870 [Kribbella sp. NPDC050124]|uniref:hypothetical protein n=1 Tax=Kribbella sp. NPDC050124 TaxID=3364114 RepID=UPI0037BB4A99
MPRWVGIAVAAAGSVLMLAGCTVPPGGVVGVSVDAAGKPVFVVQMCEGHVDGASLYLPDPDPDRAPPQDQDMGTWEVSPALTGFAQFSAETGGNGWRVSGTVRPRDPEARYRIYAWTHDNSWSADGPEFSERDLQAVQPGKLIVPPSEPESETNEIWSVAEFRAKACDVWF